MGKENKIFRARLPVSNIWNTLAQIITFPRIIAPFLCEKRNNCPQLLFEDTWYQWIAAGCLSSVSRKPSKIAFFTNCTIGSQAVSLWSPLSWWSGTGRNEWRGCTPPLILWLIAHSPLNKLLTGYQLAASPCQSCRVFHSPIVEAATVGAVVSWKLMPGASTKWRLK